MGAEPLFQTRQSPVDIARALDRDGFLCLSNAICREWLESTHGEVAAMQKGYSATTFSVVGVGDHGGPLAALVHNPSVQNLLRELVDIACPGDSQVSQSKFHSVLNVTRGSTNRPARYNLHYDAHTVSLLVPLVMPASGERGSSGELMVIPNRRPFRRSWIVNIGEKIASQNVISNRRAMKRLRRDDFEYLRHMGIGHAYLFWGYRTLHGTMPCPPGETRATLLIHLGKPHGDHWALTLATRLRKMLVWNNEVPTLPRLAR